MVEAIALAGAAVVFGVAFFVLPAAVLAAVGPRHRPLTPEGGRGAHRRRHRRRGGEAGPGHEPPRTLAPPARAGLFFARRASRSPWPQAGGDDPAEPR